MFENDAFIEQLIAKADPEADADAIETMKEEIDPMIFDRVMTNIASKFTDDQAEKFMQLVQKNVPEKEIYEYLKKAIPKYESFIEKVYDEFETMYLQEYERDE
jgi:hypothetical protein